MDIRSLIANSKEVKIEYPGLKGFKLQLSYMSKDVIKKLSEKATSIGFDSKSRQPTDIIDEELFSSLYVKQAITGWEGLTLYHLSKLIPLEGEVTADDDTLIEFTSENAQDLVNGSKDFDAWLNNVMSDISAFNKGS
jgi:hypothetical protein